jgi:Domain of unknown function (DUF4276)
MKRLVCAVEGDGEVLAIPNLCSRILLELGVTDWYVDQPIHRSRSRFVDGRGPAPHRTCRADEIERVVELALARGAAALLVICDEDDDCAKTWGPDTAAIIRRRLPGDAVMAVREYETWLLLNHPEDSLKKARAGASPEKARGAKEILARIVPGYRPTTHQLPETRRLNIAHVRARSKSFDKLVRAVAALTATA